MQRKGEILKYIAQIGKFSDQKRKFGGYGKLRFPAYIEREIFIMYYFLTPEEGITCQDSSQRKKSGAFKRLIMIFSGVGQIVSTNNLLLK